MTALLGRNAYRYGGLGSALDAGLDQGDRHYVGKPRAITLGKFMEERNMQVMKIEDAKKRQDYLAQLRPMSEQRFQHFATEQQKQDHLAHVEKYKDRTPF